MEVNTEGMNSIEYKLYEGKEAKIGADIALKNRLYVSGWCLSHDLKHIRMERKEVTVCIAELNNKPISVVIVDRFGYAMAFTRKEYRRKGIASNLIKNTGILIKSYSSGINGSHIFFNKVMEQS